MKAKEKEIKNTRKTNQYQEDSSDAVRTAEQKLRDWIAAAKEGIKEKQR